MYAIKQMIFPNSYIDLIIKHLAKHPWQSIKNLHKQLRAWTSLSLPNLYKIISQLIEQYVLVKVDGKLSLNQTWILEYGNLYEIIQNNYYNKRTNFIPTQEKEVQIIKASSFFELDMIRSDIVSERITALGEEHHMYDFNSHAYHIHATPHTEWSVFSAIQQKNSQLHYIIWWDSFLDQYGKDLLEAQWINAVIIPQHPFIKEWYFFCVINDLVLEVFLPQTLVDYFSIFFNNVHSIEEYNPEHMNNIFKMKCPCKLTIKRDQQRADELRATIIPLLEK